MYWLGQGVPQDFIEAHKWWNLSAAHLNNRTDAEERDKLTTKMSPAQVAEAQRRAAAWQAVQEPSPCLEVFKGAIRERKQN
jgi:hypothetical protein